MLCPTKNISFEFTYFTTNTPVVAPNRDMIEIVTLATDVYTSVLLKIAFETIGTTGAPQKKNAHAMKEVTKDPLRYFLLEITSQSPGSTCAIFKFSIICCDNPR